MKGVDYTGVCVVYFCHDGRGSFVMAKRSNNTKDEHGLWDIGGGAVDFDESVEEAVKREIKEEYCTDVLVSQFLGFRDVHRTHNGKKTHWIALDFKALVDPSKVKIGEPHKFDQIGWFTLENKPENTHSQLAVFFEKYKDKI